MEDERLDAVFKALADPTRRRIIGLLARGEEMSLFALCAGVYDATGKGLTRQAVTQHLTMLEAAGLVRVTWSGRTKLHRLDLDPLRAADADWLAGLRERDRP
jgi:DNA-binding transcriptional ArsR family regulator